MEVAAPSVSILKISCKICQYMLILPLQEVEEAVGFVLKELPSAIRNRTSVSLFETNIRVVGGLLAAAHLKNDKDSPELAKIAVELAGPYFLPTFHIVAR